MKHPRHLPNLDGLRFMAALSVIIFHLFTLSREVWGTFFSSDSFLLFRKVTTIGHYGVNFFFVLSGFLISYLIQREIKDSGRFSVRNFLIRRTLRIWPLYFLIVCFGFFLFPLLPYGIETKHEFWRFGLFLSNFDEIVHGHEDKINFLTATWSVSIEEQYYISMAVLMAVPLMQSRSSFRNLLAGVVVLSALFRFVHHADKAFMFYHTFSVISDMAIGGLLSLHYIRKLESAEEWNPSRLMIALVYVTGFLFLFASHRMLPGSLLAFERLISGAFFAFIIYEQLVSRHSFYKADAIPYFKTGGTMTYGLYMYHSIIIYYLSSVFQSNGWSASPVGYLAFFLLVLMFTLGIAFLSYRYVESPLLSLKKRFNTWKE